MNLIDHYQPEFYRRFEAAQVRCDCPGCQNGDESWPKVSVKMKNQQRDTLNLGCERAAREILLNPDAFILHTQQGAAESDKLLSLWDETLNQQCINLVVHPALNPQTALYAIGILLSKAQQYLDREQHDAALLVAISEELMQLADNGILAEQFAQLPAIEKYRVAALKALSSLDLQLDLPLAEKLGFALKQSELSVMSEARLAEMLSELEAIELQIDLLNEKAWIMRNILIYQLYSGVFPGVGCKDYGKAFLNLAHRLFQLRTLFALWVSAKGTLNDDHLVMLISAAEQGLSEEEPISGYEENESLLCGLALL